MTFSESIKSCFDKYATMKGRASRSEYWWFMVFNSLLSVLTAVVFYFIGLLAGGEYGALIAVGVGALIEYLALLFPNICVMVRRLHDTGHSGLWYFINLIPFGGLWFLFLLLKDSDDENEYGLPVY